jgi:hypothetical protein
LQIDQGEVTEVDEPYYWSLDIPGLSEIDARNLLFHVRRSPFGKFASAANPHDFLNVSLDRATVTSLLSALSDQHDRAVLTGGNAANASLVEEFREWLAWSASNADTDSDLPL